ncbi:flagellar biosynthesis regulatory protein FlaF [Celeribacter indicus]|uniref:Flagellar biosynthesis regulatory protein FlaF n=2 Tax=Celeribacter indicus TaxID=1208324 RepID=A0A0B5DNN0_9RHOB|nr:flagellar biosynthesis regulatory protein FlaF [Celeribacter indicus]
MARTAYSNAAAPIRTPRGTEYEAFARITHRLRLAAQDKEKAYPAYVKALHENRRLWTLLAANVADRENALPTELRARIFYLAQFTAAHTSAILSGTVDETALIDINTAIMRGLQREGE